MGRFTTICINEIIASAKVQLGLEATDEWDNFFQLFGREAIRNLRCLSIYTKHQCVLDIVDNKSQLPCNFYRLLALRFPNNSNLTGTNISGVFSFIYVDKPFLRDLGVNSNPDFICNYSQSFQINGEYIYYNTNISKFTTQSEIAYIGLNTDKDGNIIIYEDYERAIRGYMCYHFALRFKDKFSTFQVMEFKKEWIYQKAELKGEDVVFQAKNNRAEIMAVATGLLVSASSTWST